MQHFEIKRCATLRNAFGTLFHTHTEYAGRAMVRVADCYKRHDMMFVPALPI